MDTTANPLAQGLLHVDHDDAGSAFLPELDAFLRVADGLDDSHRLTWRAYREDR